jgi:hypothetical protein
VATLPEVAKIRVYGWEYNRIARLMSNLSQFSLIELAETTHHSAAIPAVVSTSLVSNVDIA